MCQDISSGHIGSGIFNVVAGLAGLGGFGGAVKAGAVVGKALAARAARIVKANRLGHERAVQDFVSKANSKGYNVVGTEVTFATPLGNRRLDVVVENLATGKIGGVEIKSTMGAFGRFDPLQFAADRWINTFGAKAVGRFDGLVIHDTIKIKWP